MNNFFKLFPFVQPLESNVYKRGFIGILLYFVQTDIFIVSKLYAVTFWL